ncbi:MAG: translation elongation factor Ts [Burkholderiales bacterium]
MAEITASMVRDLRERTSLGMMECKKALSEADGDIDKAVEILRIKSGAKAEKAASRVAAEGVIGLYVAPDGKLAAMVEINCETDFVAKNEEFLAFAHELAEKIAKNNPVDIEALGNLPAGAGTVETKRQTLVQRIGEKMSIRRFQRMATSAKVASYVHGVKIGVLVDFEGDDAAGKDVAMHIAFAKPQFLSRDQVAPAVIEKEREILMARAKESGKPADIVARMVEGGINKFLGEITLLGQPFVKDDKLTVEKAMAARKSRIRDFRFFVVGEGIEKKVADFAAEVQAQVGLAR